ncbi:Beta-hexosaminidase A precursor [Candidatus Methylomirabilis lanthanidiphila]|uniref:Beta-hexosaminidase A n=1 Tax=Candidatus Methylomirabilis lanthanidiphila TaxID=2211376 RepID=A0A564ZGM0_9BACT|nr:beta-N-acetylhexosaminidase [Candidatus Methylomirabilis lanthanidiphila]VUZ84313.1 Beta-hexosaminidase A precursor [Candidatus Methylomirabilis lanthanidiphila]
MTLLEAIGQLFILGFEGNRPSEALKAFVRELAPGGVILFGRNLGSPEEIAALTHALQAASSTPLFIAIDQEGGKVARLQAPFTRWPSAEAVGAAGSTELTAAIAASIARELMAVGINMNMAPVLDVLTNPANPVMAGRSYGSDPHMVARHGIAFFRGLAERGVIAVGKHFPGHGDTTVDSHLALPLVPHDLDRLSTVEFAPFAASISAGIPALMTAHLLIPALDREWPATLSRRILTDLLRQQMGFEGLVISDDLLMQGIADNTPPGEAAIRLLEAGGDLVLVCHDEAAQREALRAVAEAVETGRLSEARVRVSGDRIAKAKADYLREKPRASTEEIMAVVGCDAHQRLAERLA